MSQINPEPKQPYKALLHVGDRGQCMILEVSDADPGHEVSGFAYDWCDMTGLEPPGKFGVMIWEGTAQARLTGPPDSQDWDVKYVGEYRDLTPDEWGNLQSGCSVFSTGREFVDLLDEKDRDQRNPVEMSADHWAELYQWLGGDYEEYMDHDQSMNG